MLVCGGRTFSDERLLWFVLDELHAKTPITLVIQGMALGADTLARYWAHERGVTCRGFKPDWKRYGNKTAGPIRNQQMLDEGKPDLVVAFKGGKGTADMVRRSREQGFEVKTCYPEG